MPVPAAKIPVHSFRQTFLWPLIVKDPSSEEWFEKTADALLKTSERTADAHPKPKKWQKCSPFELIPGGDVGAYEEAVYFHDFVRDFLYRAGPSDPLRVFKRDDLETVTAKIGGVERSFRVDLCALHLFRSGVAILIVDLAYPNDPAAPLTLAGAQTIIDHLRRAYAPFWDEEGKPGLCPSDAKLNDRKPMGLGRLGTRATALADLKNNLREPLFPWWREILAPLPVEGDVGAQTSDAPLFRQVLDERIPVMTTISLSKTPTVNYKGEPTVGLSADLEQVSDGDWHRLAAADQAGTDDFPYNPCFLRQFEGRMFYDRFAPSSWADRSGATRFLMAGYHFAAVGAGWFFDIHVAEHMRRHYRQMNLIAYLEFATLLMISARLSRAAADMDRRSADGTALAEAERERRRCRFREQVVGIEEDFLSFIHRYRFTGVSNQLQAREMFDMLRASLGLDRLHQEVRQELEAATQFALALDQQAQTKSAVKLTLDQQAQTESAVKLTEVATLGLVLAIITGVFGMNVLIEKVTTWQGQAAFVGAVSAVVAGGACAFMRGQPFGDLRRWLRAIVIVGVLAVIGGLGALVVAPGGEAPAPAAPPPAARTTQ